MDSAPRGLADRQPQLSAEEHSQLAPQPQLALDRLMRSAVPPQPQPASELQSQQLERAKQLELRRSCWTPENMTGERRAMVKRLTTRPALINLVESI